MQNLISPWSIPVPLSDLERLAQLRAGRLRGVRRLDLSCGLTEFPREIFALADSLEILNLSGNALSRLPDDLYRLHKLRVLFCSDNLFTELPEVIGRCAALSMVGFKANRIAWVPPLALSQPLRWLILTDNLIETLPDSLGHCAAMQKLMLSGNRLQRLPDAMADCRQLELLRIAANRLTALPDWLVALPRLAWLAFAGNPLSDDVEAAAVAAHPMAIIDWRELRIEQKVGEGASGVIHLGTWRPHQMAAVAVPVAVKLFKGAMTSDGLPQSEMAAAIAAGTHTNLIGLQGRITGHPDGIDGLVMAPVDPVFRNLAGSPSFDSCTRDVYAKAQRFDLASVLSIARGIASATAHLHARGILHGDLYAHNILWDGQHGVLLGDFGAAAFFATGSVAEQANARALQQLEVRAFGCLLEELLAHCEAGAEHQQTITALAGLQHRCLLTACSDRPLFAEIGDVLSQIS